MAHGSLTPRDRELVILRTAFRVGSEYEWAQHVVIGRRAGLTDAEIERVARPADDGEWADGERALLAVADELYATDDVSEQTWAALEHDRSREQLLEVLVMAGFYRMLAGYLRGARVQLEPGMETMRPTEPA